MLTISFDAFSVLIYKNVYFFINEMAIRRLSGLLLLSSSLAELFLVGKSEKKFNDSLKWQKTKATVTLLKIVPTNHNADQIKYEYFVNGKQFNNGTLNSSGLWDSDEIAQNNFRLNEEITIIHDPQNPADSAIFAKIDRMSQCLLLCNAILFGVIGSRLIRNLPIMHRRAM